jgi:hypothetical protein
MFAVRIKVIIVEEAIVPTVGRVVQIVLIAPSSQLVIAALLVVIKATATAVNFQNVRRRGSSSRSLLSVPKKRNRTGQDRHCHPAAYCDGHRQARSK